MQIRKARQEDVAAVVDLLFESAPDMYERFSGGRRRALATLTRAFEEPGTVASCEVVWLAELDGRIAAAMAAFPVAEAGDRSSAYLRLALRGTPFWRWPATLRLYSAGGRANPKPRENSLYIDSLATDPGASPPRRRAGAPGRGGARGACALPAGGHARHHDEQRRRAGALRGRGLRRGGLPGRQPQPARLRGPRQGSWPMTARSASTTCST